MVPMVKIPSTRHHVTCRWCTMCIMCAVLVCVGVLFLQTKKNNDVDGFVNSVLETSIRQEKLVSLVRFDPIDGDAESEYMMFVENKDHSKAKRNPLRSTFTQVKSYAIENALNNFTKSDQLVIFFDMPNFNGRIFVLPLPPPEEPVINMDAVSYPTFFKAFYMYQEREFSYVLPRKYSVVLSSRVSLIQTASDIKRDTLKPGIIPNYTTINSPGVEMITITLVT
jgi:hypothetical protein